MKPLDLQPLLPDSYRKRSSLSTVALCHATDAVGQNSLSPAERQRVERLLLTDAREALAQSLAAMRTALSDQLGQSPQEINIERDSAGAPYLPDYPDMSLSLSRTTDWSALVLSKDASIGIDIEAVRRIDWNSMLPMICNATEAANLKQVMEAEADLKPFYRLWTAKEAVMKSSRKGFGMGVKNISLPATFMSGQQLDGIVSSGTARFQVFGFEVDTIVGAVAVSAD